ALGQKGRFSLHRRLHALLGRRVTQSTPGLTNSDPEMVKIFATFLRCAFGLSPDRVRVTCNLFADHEARQHEIEEFWLQTVRLPRASLCKSAVNHYSRYSQKKRKNKLPFGTCRIVVHSTEIAQTIYRLDSRAGRLRPPGVARHASLTRLIRQRLQRPGGRLELARLEAGDDLAGEGPCLADLLDLEHGVDGREVIAVDQGQFDVDGVEISFCDVGILGNTDPDAHRPAIRQRRDRLDRLSSQAHALRILAQRA